MVMVEMTLMCDGVITHTFQTMAEVVDALDELLKTGRIAPQPANDEDIHEDIVDAT